jgi:hypothetical protein
MHVPTKDEQTQNNAPKRRCDGELADPIRRFVEEYSWDGLLVEPLPGRKQNEQMCVRVYVCMCLCVCTCVCTCVCVCVCVCVCNSRQIQSIWVELLLFLWLLFELLGGKKKKKMEHIKTSTARRARTRMSRNSRNSGNFLYQISVAHLHQIFFLHNKDSIPRIILLYLM